MLGSLCSCSRDIRMDASPRIHVEAMKAKRPHPKRLFKDSWRPEDKALESAEEEALERDYGEEIARDRARRHKQTPAIVGFDKAPPPASEPSDPPPRDR
jgi:hypothetical protein